MLRFCVLRAFTDALFLTFCVYWFQFDCVCVYCTRTARLRLRIFSSVIARLPTHVPTRLRVVTFITRFDWFVCHSVAGLLFVCRLVVHARTHVTVGFWITFAFYVCITFIDSYPSY